MTLTSDAPPVPAFLERSQLLHRLRESAFASWGHGLSSVTRLHGTRLYQRQKQINRASAEIATLIQGMIRR